MHTFWKPANYQYVPFLRLNFIDLINCGHNVTKFSLNVYFYTATQCIVIGPVCGFVIAGGRAVSEPYYSQRAQCLRLFERFLSAML